MTTPAPSPFSLNIPNWQVAWDSTSLGWFKKCPQLYKYNMIDQWAPKRKSIHLTFGGYYASGVERYAHHRAKDMDHESAILAVVKWVMAETWFPQADPTCPICHGVGLVPQEEHDFPDSVNCECVQGRPWETGDSYKNRYTLVRTLIWNLDDRNESTAWTTVILANGKPAVELSFTFPIFEIEGEQIYISGHMDEMVRDSTNSLWVKDDKTTKSQLDKNYFNQWTPNNQMSLYSVAGKVVYNEPVKGVIIRAAQIQVGGSRFATAQAPRPAPVLDEWLADFKVWVGLARQYAVANHWPKNDTACNDYGGCPFRAVCAVSPSHRKSWLEADFVKRAWNPLEARGDI
jgi:hypothetical protein